MVNEIKPQRPNIDPIKRRLSALEKSDQIAKAAKENPDFVENVVYKGFNELIGRFNSLKIGDKEMTLIPTAVALKEKLGDWPLPTIEELGVREFISGIGKAERLMVVGQDIKKGDVPEKNKDLAIMSPSIETNDLALVVGTSAHILEETVYVHFRERGIPTWAKDEFLFPLEDIVLLMHAETLAGTGHESPLFSVMTTPPSLDPSGGMGWKKAEHIDDMVRRYNELQSR